MHTVDAHNGEHAQFSWGTIDGELIDSSQTRGRLTVLLFMTTFDLSSQEQAKRLQDLQVFHKPRINAVGVMLEAPRNIDLVRTFRDSIGITYPITLFSTELLKSSSWGPVVHGIPTWVFLDREGRIAAVHEGPLSPSQLLGLARSHE